MWDVVGWWWWSALVSHSPFMCRFSQKWRFSSRPCFANTVRMTNRMVCHGEYLWVFLDGKTMGCILTTAYRWIWRHDRILRATLFLTKPFGDHSPFSVSENPNFGWFVPRSGSLVTGGVGKSSVSRPLHQIGTAQTCLLSKLDGLIGTKTDKVNWVPNFLCQIQVVNYLSWWPSTTPPVRHTQRRMAQGWAFHFLPPSEGESPALMLQQLWDFGGLFGDLHPCLKNMHRYVSMCKS